MGIVSKAKEHRKYLNFSCYLHLVLVLTLSFIDNPAETVIYRIFYYINRSGTGCLTLRELKRGNLIAAMQQLDEEDDINKIIR